MKKFYSVAVRPSAKVVKDNGFHYEANYYEDREGVYEVATKEEAIARYKVDYGYFITRSELPYLVALEVKSSYGIRQHLREAGVGIQEYILQQGK